ncbi:MAG: pyridoxal phosphate-dependent aminotransferase [Myxococcota bacterium]|nr:pyridoxal phosphate-dependent aminotransferase [Myxococcota bacterium]
MIDVLDTPDRHGYSEPMDPPGARRLRDVEPFLAMEVLERALAMEREGTAVSHLEVGEPDSPAPEPVIEACQRALRAGVTHYTDSRGVEQLREAIAADLQRRFGVSVEPSRVIVTMGTSPAMWLSFQTLIDPGDEVVLGTPHYPCYPNFIRLCGGVPVYVETDPDDRYCLDPERVRAALTPRTRAILVCSPANPTGAVQTRETIAELAALGPTLVSDEIYDGLVYDTARVSSALEHTRDAFVFDGFSKRYAMTGFRLGWVVAPEWAARPLQILQQSLFISASSFVQHAGIAALEQGAPAVEAMRARYAMRRTRLVDGLRRLGFGVAPHPPGAGVVLADARPLGSCGRDSRELAFALLERAHVGSTPGIDFGSAAEGWLRFSYAVADEVIDEALARLEAALPQLADPVRGVAR